MLCQLDRQKQKDRTGQSKTKQKYRTAWDRIREDKTRHMIVMLLQTKEGSSHSSVIASSHLISSHLIGGSNEVMEVK